MIKEIIDSSSIIDPFKRMVVLEGEIEGLKETLRSYMTIFNDIHIRMAEIEKKVLKNE